MSESNTRYDWTASFIDLINTHLRECGDFHGHRQVKDGASGLEALRSIFGKANSDKSRANGLAMEVLAKREHFLSPTVETLHLVNEAEAATDAAGWLKEEA